MLEKLYKPILIVSLSLSSFAVTANNFTHQNVDKAQEILDKVVEHHGGKDAISNVDNVLVDYDYSINYRTQGYGYKETDYHSNRPGNAYSLTSYSKQLAWSQYQSYYMNSFTANTTLFKEGENTKYNDISRTFTEKTQGDFDKAIESQLLRNPILIIKTALIQKDTLRYLGDKTENGKHFSIIAMTLPSGKAITTYVNQLNHQISKVELLRNGKLTEYFYSDYRAVGKFQIPFFIKRNMPEHFYSSYFYYNISSYDFSPNVAQLAVIPKGYVFAEKRNTFDGKLRLQTIGNNIYWVTRNGNNTIFVEFSDHIMAVDAFGYKPEDMTAKIAKMREVIPVKPIKYVSISHHHNDHIHEVPFYTKNNTTIITAEAFKPQLIERIANADVSKNLTPKFDIVNKKRTYADETQHVEIYELKSMLHAETMLMTYFPKEQLIYFPDLYEEGYLIENQHGIKALLAEIDRLNLNVKGFIPAHDNKVHSLEKIKAALAHPIEMKAFRRQPHHSVTHSENT